LAVVIGGTSAEFTLKTVKLASARYLDDMPTTGTIYASAKALCIFVSLEIRIMSVDEHNP